MSYDTSRFQNLVSDALNVVRKVLKANRQPVYAENAKHLYSDKFLLTEYMVNLGVQCAISLLQKRGMNKKAMDRMVGWTQAKKAVTLRFEASEACKFLRKSDRKVESNIQEAKVGVGPISTTVKSKTVTTVTEYFWNYEVKYSLVLYPATDAIGSERLIVDSATVRMEIMSTSEKSPYPENSERPPLDLTLTWLIGMIQPNLDIRRFTIDRASSKCHTPRRNEQIDDMVQFFSDLREWSTAIDQYLKAHVSNVFPTKYHEPSTQISGVFFPVLPLMSTSTGDDVILDAESTRALMTEFERSYEEQMRKIPVDSEAQGVLQIRESLELGIWARLLTRLSSISLLAVDYVEILLYRQLRSALGRVLGPADFEKFMDYHVQHVFRPEYRPSVLSYAVRRPDHFPEGLFSIQKPALYDGSEGLQPMHTFVFQDFSQAPMTFDLSASARVTLGGDRFLHAGVLQKFSVDELPKLTLSVRAKQFSSFLVLAGRINGPDSFSPSVAMIVRNRDDLSIPLSLSTIPSAKEFRDAISSLSPEQQRFAKAFRGMQLESTLFGLAVVQIKPQLEQLLKMPAGALTKEVKLTEQLMELFIKYQIPSDLLTYEGSENPSVAESVAQVRKNVKDMHDMLDKMREDILKETAQEAEENMLSNHLEYASMMVVDAMPPPPVFTRSPVSKSGRGGVPSAPGGGFGGGRQMMAKMAMPMAPASVMSFSSAPCPAPPPAQSTPTSMSMAPPPPTSTAAGTGVQQQAPKVQLLTEQSREQTDTQMPEEKASKKVDSSSADSALADESNSFVDFSKVPGKLESAFDQMDASAPVRPTIINLKGAWKKRFYRNILAQQSQSMLDKAEQKSMKDEAFDLLDALSRSGSLSLNYSSLHVIVLATYCFDKTLMDTLICDNVNPIEKLEKTLAVMAGIVYDVPSESVKL